MSEPYEHQTVRDYVDAKGRGDADTADRIIAEAKARIEAGTANAAEITELFRASTEVPLGKPQ